MSKIFVLSFDDGTIWDERFIELLNKYNIPATFNLNSGLEDFVWYYDNQPIQRIHIKDKAYMYEKHEIASHTYTHPYITTLTDEQLHQELYKDTTILKEIFNLDEIGFGVPFSWCNEREINIIKNYVSYIRLSEMTNEYQLPIDQYHIKIHGLYNDIDIKEKIYNYANNELNDSLFVLCGHSYEFEMLNHWEYIEELLQYIQSFDFNIMTMKQFVNKYYREG